MPIVDIEVICQSDAQFGAIEDQLLADSVGKAIGSPPGRTWVKLRHLGSAGYAENEAVVSGPALPVFVSILHAQLPPGDALAAEARAVTLAVASCLGRAPGFVHVLYEASGAGRQAFGGTLVT